MEEEKKAEEIEQTEPVEEEGTQKEKLKNVFLYKNFSLAFFGALVSNLGATLYSFAVSFYILELTGNNAFIQGLYLAVGGIIYAYLYVVEFLYGNTALVALRHFFHVVFKAL